jgi:proteasome assembly chaperone (PAC2) family protein
VSHLEWVFRPEVARPLVICAFAGWNDGGEAATTTVRYLKDQWGARRFAGLDPEEFYDFQVHRPTVRLLDGITRRVDWPSNDLFQAQPGGRDVVLFLGVEPNTRWRTYCDAILRVASEFDAEALVTLGAFLADVPHTMAAPVSAASADPDWLERPEIEPVRYEGPTGITGVLNDAAANVGLAAVSLWAAAPHYLPTGTNPKVALALLEALRDLFGLEVDTADMARAAVAWQRQVSEAIEEDGNLQDYVRRLEEASSERGDVGRLPDADDLAAEVERYLRDRDDG